MLGADPEQLAELEATIRRCADRVAAAADELARVRWADVWVGERADAARIEWMATVRRCRQTVNDLRERAAAVASQRREQLEASTPFVSPTFGVTPAMAGMLGELIAGGGRRGDVVNELLGGAWESMPGAIRVMHVDPSGDGRLVVAYGDPATARNVAVYVPGTGASFDGARADLDRGLALWNAAGPETAVITWIGYDAPNDVVGEATKMSFARDGGRELAAFVRSLDLDAGVELTLVGFSYGSVVVGEASRRLGTVQNVVLVGSPGAGEGVHRAEQLRAERVYSLAADRDPVTWGDVHGTRPDAPSFGAIRVEVGEAHGHGDYLKEGSTSVRQIGHIIEGRHDLVERAPTDWGDVVADRVFEAISSVNPIGIGVREAYAYADHHVGGAAGDLMDLVGSAGEAVEGLARKAVSGAVNSGVTLVDAADDVFERAWRKAFG